MKYSIVYGNILEQSTEAIVNPWNRNIIPWWLLLPQGVSGEIKKKAGLKPFLELPKFKSIKLGEAVMTSAGNLKYKAIIHVAGINLFWRASEYSILNSTKNAIILAKKKKINSIAMPLIGTGSGGFNKTQSFLKICFRFFRL